MKRIKTCALFIAVTVIAVSSAACTNTQVSNSNTAAQNTNNSSTDNLNTTSPNTSNSNMANSNTTSVTQGPTAGADTPTAAYKALFYAVKRKDTEAIKRNISKQTLNLAQMTSQTYKKTLEDSLKNGMTESTMQPAFPQVRDEKIDGDQATIDVSKPNGQWERVPFVKEDGGWKLAFGEAFSGKIKMTPVTNANTTPIIPRGPGGPGPNANMVPPNTNPPMVPPNAKRQKIDERKPPEKQNP